MLNSHYLLVLNTLKRVTDKTKMIFRSKKKKKIKTKYKYAKNKMQ